MEQICKRTDVVEDYAQQEDTDHSSKKQTKPMETPKEQTTTYAWLTGQFLFELDEQIRKQPNVSIGQFYEKFLNEKNISGLSFSLKNQGTIFMLLYGIFVMPKEIWKNNEALFDFKSRKYFKLLNNIGLKDDDSNQNFLRLLRNSIAHANFEIVKSGNLNVVKLWNVKPNKNRDINFVVEISYENIGYFLTEVGLYFINFIKPLGENDN